MQPLKTRRWMIRVSLGLGIVYIAYLIKTALGINISHRYSAPGIFKLPLTYLRHKSSPF